MSDSHDYNQQYEQQPPSGPPQGGSQGSGAPPPPGPPPPQQVNYAPPQPRGKKSQVLAGILSGLIPGLGNIYVGYYTRGFVQAMVFILCIVALSSEPGGGAEPLFGIFLGFWWFFGIIDAVRCAGALNLALAGGEEMPNMPQNLSIPSEGSKTWGLVLMAVGVIFFMSTKFDFSLDWLAEWWPLLLVGFGGWLYWKARKAEKERTQGEGLSRPPME